MNRKILIVAYHFPPDGAVGSVRPAKFAKHLKALGWEPFILSVRERHIPLKDPQRLRDVEGVPVLRTSVWPTLPGLAMRWRDRLRRRGGPGSAAPAAHRQPPPAERRPGLPGRWFNECKRVLNSLLELPDQQIGWLFPATWEACRLVHRERIQVVLTTSPPQTASLVGLCLKRLCRVKLVTDLRDPWYLSELKQLDSRSRASDAIETRLERVIMKSSELVITTTDHYRTHLQEKYPQIPAGRFRTIWNGFDAEDFQGLEEARVNGKFTLSYLGTFYLGRTPWELLQALKELVAEGVLPSSGLQVDFIGNVRTAEGRSVEERVNSLGLSGCVRVQDPVPYRESLRKMKESDVLLLFAPFQYHCIPGKAYEYLGAGKRILCLAEEGATADLIRKMNAGIVVDPRDVPGIKSALRDLYREHLAGGSSPAAPDACRFERKNLSRELAELIEGELRAAPSWRRSASEGINSIASPDGQSPTGKKKIGLLTPYCGGNLGDGAIHEALIQNLRKHRPDAEVYGFTLNPEEIERLHGIPSFHVAGFSVSSYPVVPRREAAGAAPRGEARIYSPLKDLLKRIPILFSALKAVRQGARIFSAELAHITRSYRILKGFDLLLVAGGGQLDDLWGGAWGHPYALFKWSVLSKVTGASFVFLSVGANYPRSAWSRAFYRIALSLADYRSYRDRRSKEAVSVHRVTRDDPCYPDIAFSLELRHDRTAKGSGLNGPVIGIGPIAYCDPRSWPMKDRAVYQRYLQQMAEFLSWVLEKEYRVLFFTSTRPDRNVVQDLMSSLKQEGLPGEAVRIAEPPVGDVYDLLGTLQTVDYVVASRLHGVILSHLLCKPVVAVSFDRKVDSYMEEVGQAEFLLDIHKFDAGSLIERFEKLRGNRDAVQADLGRKVLDYRRSLEIQYERLFKLRDDRQCNRSPS